MKAIRKKHPFDDIRQLSAKELEQELNTWSRNELIEWLCWNDPNGVYTDKDSLAEIGHVLSKEEGIEIIIRQIKEGSPLRGI
ncbi:hypothetical protein [Myroides phaeus]|uniref:Uncharacterized protein n=1 Tax=Myroides phaeus TaxID=702745 RepID=A0A1G8EEK8_9FLAO|nr:hypothetical protein [Myroides phaeus]SDH68149.1 hypothetical protein SAMN05421818_11069 [Myroides phaeus]